ncbi:MAG: glycosyltransferase family 87 protein [Planctomycetota bacterium]
MEGKSWPLVALTCLLAGMALLYAARGVAHLVAGEGAGDLRIRWSAQRYAFDRQNPYDVQERVWALQEGRAAAAVARRVEPRSDLGAPGVVGDPPWAFVSGAVLYGAPWPEVRWIFAGVSLAALAVLGRWAWRLGRPFGKRGAALLSAAALAPAAHGTAIGLGQPATIVLALLALLLALERRRVASGLILGVANLKLNVAAPFVLPFLARGRWAAIAVAGAYWLACSLLVWRWLATDPLEWTGQMFWGTPLLELADVGALSFLAERGLGGPGTVLLLALAAAGVGLAGLRTLRGRPLLESFAVAGVVARVGTYHRVYDNGLIVFLLVALGVAFLERPTRSRAAAFLAVGVTLWLPSRLADGGPAVALQLAVWCGATALLCRWGCGRAETPAAAGPAVSPAPGS